MLTRVLILGLTTGMLFSGAARAEENRPGVTNAEILIGQTNPYSGPLSAYGTQGRAQAAYYKMVNDEGGVNGRKIKLISLDDGYSPPKTVEQHRRLIEGDEVGEFFRSEHFRNRRGQRGLAMVDVTDGPYVGVRLGPFKFSLSHCSSSE